MFKSFHRAFLLLVLLSSATATAAFAQETSSTPPAPAAPAPAAPAPQSVPSPATAAPVQLDYASLPEPMTFAKEQYALALRLNAMNPGPERTSRLKAFVDSLVNYRELARRTLGDKWSALDENKKNTFQASFSELLELTYLKKLSDKSFKNDYRIDWDRVVKNKTAATVSCFTQKKDVETEFEIVLHAENGRWIIYDVLVDGASLVNTYQKKYHKQIESKSVDGLLADMNERIAKLKTQK